MSTRNRMSTSSATKIDRLSLALNESYDEEIAPLLTTIDQSKSFANHKNNFFFYKIFLFQVRNRIADIDTTIDLPAIVVIGEQSSGLFFYILLKKFLSLKSIFQVKVVF